MSVVRPSIRHGPVADNSADVPVEVKFAFFELINRVLKADPSEFAELEHYILPHGSTTSKGYHILNYFPRGKAQVTDMKFRSMVMSDSITAKMLRDLFTDPGDHSQGDIYANSEWVVDPFGQRKAIKPVYSKHLFLHHRFMQDLIKLWEPTDNSSIILWGAFAQAYWEVYYDGVSVIIIRGKSVVVYRIDHTEYLLSHAPGCRIRGAIETLIRIAQVHGVSFNLAKLEKRITRLDKDNLTKTAEEKKMDRAGKVAERAINDAVARTTKVTEWAANHASTQKARQDAMEVKQDAVDATQYVVKAKQHVMEVKQNVRQTGLDLLLAGVRVQDASRCTPREPTVAAFLSAPENEFDPAGIEYWKHEFTKAKAQIVELEDNHPSDDVLRNVFNEAYDANQYLRNPPPTDVAQSERAKLFTQSKNYLDKKDAQYADPVWQSMKSERSKETWQQPGVREKVVEGQLLFFSSDVGKETYKKRRVGGELYVKRQATVESNRPPADTALCKALLAVDIDPMTHGLDPGHLLVRCS